MPVYPDFDVNKLAVEGSAARGIYGISVEIGISGTLTFSMKVGG